MLSLGDSLASIEPWLRQYGYWVLVVTLALENVLFTSMVVPGLLVLILAGFWAGLGRFDIRLLLLFGVASAWLGDSLSYSIGRFFWARLLMNTRLGKSVLRLQPLLQQRGAVFLVLYHFEPAARMVGGTLAGAAGLSVRRWLPFDFLGAALWVTFYTMLGFLLGRFGHSISDWETVRPVSAGVLVVLLVWLWLFNRAVKRSLSSRPAGNREGSGREVNRIV
jgi:membrane protein DedA with SNARE-associated domain